MPKSQHSGFSPRLREIKENFPMPGTYHFRFKTALIPGSDREKNAVAVWMDCVDDSQHVGVWRNTIVAKVTRISMEEEDDDEDFARYNHNDISVHHAVPAAATQHHHRTQPQPVTAPSPPATAPAPAVSTTSDNLLGFDDHNHKPYNSAPPSGGSLLDVDHHPNNAGEGSLLDMNGPTSYNTNVQHSSSHDDFLGMTSTPVSATPAHASTPAAPASYGMPHPVANNNGNAQRPNKALETFTNSGPFGGLNWD